MWRVVPNGTDGGASYSCAYQARLAHNELMGQGRTAAFKFPLSLAIAAFYVFLLINRVQTYTAWEQPGPHHHKKLILTGKQSRSSE